MPENYNQEQINNGNFTIEQITELVRFWQENHELTIDGFCGPDTRASIDTLLMPIAAPDEWDDWQGSIEDQPSSRQEVYGLFGNPGSGSLSKRWYRDNIVELHSNNGNRLPGAPSHQYIHLNKKVEPYVREALRRAQITAPEFVITRIGSFNFRHIRHDKRQPLSMHSWGIALDINPTENRGKVFKRGDAPEPWSPEWMAIWPSSVPEAFVKAMRSCGFAWGGDWDGDGLASDHKFIDPMHFEWVDRG